MKKPSTNRAECGRRDADENWFAPFRRDSCIQLAGEVKKVAKEQVQYRRELFFFLSFFPKRQAHDIRKCGKVVILRAFVSLECL